MALKVEPTGGVCGAIVTGIDLTAELSADCIAELRSHWLAHKVLVFPDQKLSNSDLERFTLCFGEFGEDPFFGHIDGHKNIAAIQRRADERTPLFAETFHSDWSFLNVPPAGTVLYGITSPPQGGNTLFADQVAAYERLLDDLEKRAGLLSELDAAGERKLLTLNFGPSVPEPGTLLLVDNSPVCDCAPTSTPFKYRRILLPSNTAAA